MYTRLQCFSSDLQEKVKTGSRDVLSFFFNDLKIGKMNVYLEEILISGENNMEQNYSIRLSDSYADIADIHDALYTYNLSRTKRKRIAVSAERYHEQFAFLVCDGSGEKHGGIAFHWKNEPRHIFVDFLFLEEEYRGGGIGRNLLEHFLNYARENGAVRIDLTTNTFQAPDFYLKMGFRITGEKKEPSPGCPENIHYSLSLDL